MIVPFVDLKAQYISIKKEIDNAIFDIIDKTAFIGGASVYTFERNFEKKYGVKNCISVANGTDAIYITLKMLGLGRGDEVITVANSWISSSEAISQTGAKVKFADIDPETYTISPSSIREKLTENTKAILPVHLFGQSAHMSEIMTICTERNLFLVEDCAQAHFTEENGQRVGTFGEAGTFSFYPGKNLGAYGDAGCIITNNDELADRFRMFANHGALQKHHHKIEGVNSRLDGIQAAVLNIKLKYIDDWTTQRRLNAILYNTLLSDVNEIILPKERENTKHTYHLYVIRTSRRNELKEYLETRGISCAIHYPKILPNLEAYDFMRDSSSYPIANQYESQILSLPLYPELSKNQIFYVSECIHDFFDR